MTRPPSRRRFLAQSVAGAAATLGAASSASSVLSAQSQDRVAGANRRVRIALIGCGGMGNSDLRDMLKSGAQLVALCDVDDRQVTKTAATVSKNFSQTAEFTTRDFRKVLDRKDIDAVIVGTPDHWHALPAVMACQAGKDVYVEKPLSLTIGEGRVMVDAARTYERVVQMGTQQRSAQHFTDAVAYVKSGALGKIRLVQDVGLPGLDGQHPQQARWSCARPRSTTTCGSGRRSCGRTTRTASTSTSAGTTTTRAG